MQRALNAINNGWMLKHIVKTGRWRLMRTANYRCSMQFIKRFIHSNLRLTIIQITNYELPLTNYSENGSPISELYPRKRRLA